ncbi:MAG TPA: enolase C-terminal domain-like protein [Chthoniobacteraceae bacterium]|nr:enolase C-terminal domain-like protein [Chthoniobacteraceae bacterium]
MKEIARIRQVSTTAYTIPTDRPESDGTFEWTSTTMVLVEILAGDKSGLGFSYTDATAAKLVQSDFAPLITGRNAVDIASAHGDMVRRVRNLGRPGLAATAISAVDNALWDLKAKLLGVSLLDLLGAAREEALIYGSGGFTSYDIQELQSQLSGWAEEGISMVKMKIGRDAAADIERVRAAREAIGPSVRLAVDANGAYGRKEALAQARHFAEQDVCWFEEPVSSDDLEGLRLIRDRLPPGMRVAAGEYGYDADYFRHMLAAGAVDVLQADATRCLGITGFLEAATLAAAHHVPFSFHCAPALHASLACAVPSFWVGEYFHDHVRIEQMLFDGAPRPVHGALRPDRSRPGLGLDFKRSDAARYAQ